MQIITVFWILIVVELLLLIYFLILSSRIDAKEKKQNIPPEDIKEPPILNLDAQINFLQDKLEKAESSYTSVQNEIQDLKKQKSELSRELVSKEQELEEMLSQSAKTERASQERNQELQNLNRKNKEMFARLKDLEVQIEKLEQTKQTQGNIIAEYREKEEHIQPDLKEEVKSQSRLEIAREQNRKKIGEILLANNFITEDILDKALEYQAEVGGNITQYLLANGYIDEGQLARCLCTQFGIPYLPLSSYEIPEEIIKLVPVDIVERYWLVPVDKFGNVLIIVMADPLDTNAIKEVEEATGCKVQVFLGLLSEIIEALHSYYRILIKERESRAKMTLPFFIDTHLYKGPERRQSVRFRAKINIKLIHSGQYRACKTKDVSRDGFLFECESAIPIGSLLTVQIDLPKEFNPLPIATVVQVVRVVPLEKDRFEVGLKIMKISKQELNAILEYASTHKEE